MIKVVSNEEQTATGPLPITFNSDGTPLDDYKLYGTADGSGVETENLWDGYLEQGTLDSEGSEMSADNRVRSNYIKLSEAGEYTISIRNSSRFYLIIFLYDESKSFIGVDAGSWQVMPYTFTLNSPCYIRIVIRRTNNNPVIPTDISEIRLLVPGSTAPSAYTPYGYKLPMTVESGAQSQNIPIYIGDSKLGAEEYVDYESGKVHKRTESIYDKNATDTSKGYKSNYILYFDGREGGSTAIWAISEYMSIDPEKPVILKMITSLTGTAQTPSICFYNEEKEFVSGVAYNLSQVQNVFLTFNPPPTAKYVRASVLRGEDAESFIYNPYLQPTDPPVPLPELSTYSGENTLSCSEVLGDESQITYVGPVEETITKIMRTEDDGQGNVTEHVLYKEGS